MKKFSTVLFVLVWFSVSIFGEGNKPQFPPEIISQIPKSYGLLDSAVVAPDKKSFYTLKDGVVTHWQLHPIKKLNSFQSNIHNEQLYVSQDMKDYYKHNKYANNKPKLSFLGDKLKIESNKVVEHWDVNSNKLVYGAPIVAKHISFRLKNLKNSILKISSYTNIRNIGWRKRGENKRGVKYVTKISITSGGKIIYGEYLSTDIKLLHHNYTFLPKKRLVNNSLKYIVTFNDTYQQLKYRVLNFYFLRYNAPKII